MSRVRITGNDPGPAGATTCKDIPIGTYFFAAMSQYPRGLYLRTYDSIVSLDEPRRTWGCTSELGGQTREVEVREFEEVDMEIKVLRRNT